MSASLLISGTPGVAATAIHSTAVVASPSTTATPLDEAPILVSNYRLMLQSLVSKNEDQVFYDASSMSGQILCTTDEQGNRTYQVVEGKGEELMQFLNADDKNYYHAWLNDQLQDNQECAYTLSSTDKGEQHIASYHGVGHKQIITDPTTTALLFTPNQVNKIKDANNTLGTLTHNPLTNNVFEQEGLQTALMAVAALIGIKLASATAAWIASTVAATSTLAITVPAFSEWRAHVNERKMRDASLNSNTVNDYLASRLVALEKGTPHTMIYLSESSANCANFAMKWRTRLGMIPNGFRWMFGGTRKNYNDERHVYIKDLLPLLDRNDTNRDLTSSIQDKIKSLPGKEQTPSFTIVSLSSATDLNNTGASYGAYQSIAQNAVNSAVRMGEGARNSQVGNAVAAAAAKAGKTAIDADNAFEENQRLDRWGNRRAIGPAEWTVKDTDLLLAISNKEISPDRDVNTLEKKQKKDCLELSDQEYSNSLEKGNSYGRNERGIQLNTSRPQEQHQRRGLFCW